MGKGNVVSNISMGQSGLPWLYYYYDNNIDNHSPVIPSTLMCPVIVRQLFTSQVIIVMNSYHYYYYDNNIDNHSPVIPSTLMCPVIVWQLFNSQVIVLHNTVITIIIIV
jgi:hypothetical protein